MFEMIISNSEQLNSAMLKMKQKKIHHDRIILKLHDIYFGEGKEAAEFAKQYAEMQGFAETIEIEIRTSLNHEDTVVLINSLKSPKVISLDFSGPYGDGGIKLTDFPNLRQLSFSSTKDTWQEFSNRLAISYSSNIETLSLNYPSFLVDRADTLNLILQLVKKNRHLKKIGINGKDFPGVPDITSLSKHNAALIEQINHHLSINSGYSLEGLSVIEKELQEARDRFQQATETYDFQKQKHSKVSPGVEKELEHASENLKVNHNKLFEIAEFLLQEGIVDAGYYLAKELRTHNPERAYQYLINIPHSSEFFKEANSMIAHLFMDESVYQKIFFEKSKPKEKKEVEESRQALDSNLQKGKAPERTEVVSLDEEESSSIVPRSQPSSSIEVQKKQELEMERQKKVMHHLLLAEDREILPHMLFDYVYGEGALDNTTNNAFKDIPVGKESYSSMFFMLDIFRKNVSHGPSISDTIRPGAPSRVSPDGDRKTRKEMATTRIVVSESDLKTRSESAGIQAAQKEGENPAFLLMYKNKEDRSNETRGRCNSEPDLRKVSRLAQMKQKGK